jgi:hypothetical protein
MLSARLSSEPRQPPRPDAWLLGEKQRKRQMQVTFDIVDERAGARTQDLLVESPEQEYSARPFRGPAPYPISPSL